MMFINKEQIKKIVTKSWSGKLIFLFLNEPFNYPISPFSYCSFFHDFNKQEKYVSAVLGCRLCLTHVMGNWYQTAIKIGYCESTIVCRVPIFVVFVGSPNHEIWFPTKWRFPLMCILNTSKPPIQESKKLCSYHNPWKLVSTK